MNHLGINVNIKNAPQLDRECIPMGVFNREFLKTAKKPVSFAVERSGGQVAVVNTFIHGTAEMAQADTYYADRLVKSMLWMQGGFKVYISGDEGIYNHLKAAYAPDGSRAFDADFMAGVYEKPFEVVLADQVPAEKGAAEAVGRHLGGCRIGQC